MLQYIYLAQLEHREWERRFNARAARGDFVRNAEEQGTNLVDVLRVEPSDLVHRVFIGVAALSCWIRRLRGTATVPSIGTGE